MGEKVFTDVYFDDANFSLTGADKWLRSRDGRFELKLPLNHEIAASERIHDQYEELESPEKIASALGINFTGDLRQDLIRANLAPFATITTTRKKFQKGEFHLDFDATDSGFSVGEVEVMVENESQMDEALNRIKSFALEHGLELVPVLGKVPDYIRKHNPKHFQFLIDKGVI